MASERRSETSRLEGFSDAVFAFALTLLVVSLQVPSSYDELVHTLRSFVAFAPSFAALIWIWFLHREFFRRYGLGDGPMVFLNSLLLFVVLLYVYPLKFLATLVFGQMLDPANTAPIESSQVSQLIAIYGVGYVAVFVVFSLMYLYALRKRPVLHLTRLDLYDARYAIEANVINIGTGLGSILLALLGAPPLLAGFFYLVLGPLRAVHEAGGVAGDSSGLRAAARARQICNRGLPPRVQFQAAARVACRPRSREGGAAAGSASRGSVCDGRTQVE